MRNYLRCVASVGENLDRLPDYLDNTQLAEDTFVIYTTGHGIFPGRPCWYDKQFMYGESSRIPFLMRYPGAVQAGATSERIALSVDFAPTILDYAGLPIPRELQGRSLRLLAEGESPSNRRKSMYCQ